MRRTAFAQARQSCCVGVLVSSDDRLILTPHRMGLFETDGIMQRPRLPSSLMRLRLLLLLRRGLQRGSGCSSCKFAYFEIRRRPLEQAPRCLEPRQPRPQVEQRVADFLLFRSMQQDRVEVSSLPVWHLKLLQVIPAWRNLTRPHPRRISIEEQ